MLNPECCINTLSLLCLQCSRGTLSYIQSQCQSALSNLASEPETGAHRLLSLLPATLQHCEEIHNEVSAAAAAAVTCTTACTCGLSDIPEKSCLRLRLPCVFLGPARQAPDD